MATKKNILDRIGAMVSRARDISGEISKDMETMRAELADKQAERNRMASLPVEDERIRARIDAALDAHAREARSVYAESAFAAPDRNEGDLRPLMRHDPIGGLVLLGFRNQMAEHLFSMATDGQPKGITDDDRQAALVRLDREIEVLARALERLRRQAAATAGIDVPISEGTRPEYYLVGDEDLNDDEK